MSKLERLISATERAEARSAIKYQRSVEIIAAKQRRQRWREFQINFKLLFPRLITLVKIRFVPNKPHVPAPIAEFVHKGQHFYIGREPYRNEGGADEPTFEGHYWRMRGGGVDAILISDSAAGDVCSTQSSATGKTHWISFPRKDYTGEILDALKGFKK